MCEECGIWKERDGSYSEIIPSDCHPEGGHYLICYDRHGKCTHDGRPWQVGGGNAPELTDDEMATAKVA